MDIVAIFVYFIERSDYLIVKIYMDKGEKWTEKQFTMLLLKVAKTLAKFIINLLKINNKC